MPRNTLNCAFVPGLSADQRGALGLETAYEAICEAFVSRQVDDQRLQIASEIRKMGGREST